MNISIEFQKSGTVERRAFHGKVISLQNMERVERNARKKTNPPLFETGNTFFLAFHTVPPPILPYYPPLYPRKERMYIEMYILYYIVKYMRDI